jgi:phosphoserine aminotransferase
MPTHKPACWNFSAGPARMPDEVLARASAEMFTRDGSGVSVMERPFTGDVFRAHLAHAQACLRQLLNLPDHYRILFLAGGAMHQFSNVPLNLLGNARIAAYADSGYWAKRAIAEAQRFTEVAVVARHAGESPLAAPDCAGWQLPDDCAYCHITPNETVEGIAYPSLPDFGSRHDVPLVADCTSCFLAAPLDISRFGVVYASAQKNIGPAGLTVVIVREDLLERSAPNVPAPFSYRLQAEQNSCVNTPPTLAIHLAALVFEWLIEGGGIEAMTLANRQKASRLYAAIDVSDGFYNAPIAREHRSTTNVRFHLTNDALTDVFVREAELCGLTNLRGHRHIGGIRASLYNAMPEAGVIALTEFMAGFAQRHG